MNKLKTDENPERRIIVPEITYNGDAKDESLVEADKTETVSDAIETVNDATQNSNDNLMVVEDDEVTLKLPKLSEDGTPREVKKKKRFCLHSETKSTSKVDVSSSDTSSVRTTSQMSFVETSRTSTPTSSPEETRNRRKPSRGQISKIVPLAEVNGSTEAEAPKDDNLVEVDCVSRVESPKVVNSIEEGDGVLRVESSLVAETITDLKVSNGERTAEPRLSNPRGRKRKRFQSDISSGRSSRDSSPSRKVPADPVETSENGNQNSNRSESQKRVKRVK